MCCRKKKSPAMSQKDHKGKSDMGTPKTHTPQTPADKPPSVGVHKAEHDENVIAKTYAENPLARSKLTGDNLHVLDEKKEPLHIKVPPPRILKARRVMKEVKEARDPAYKTLDPNLSEWESVKIIKRSEFNLEEVVRKNGKASESYLA